eukprot:CAMPEP_0172380394 /NCGR_PEP_ID=MMETSP1060-20121228/70414_1 /TAXON_ID=37318 /ORGANISM="Pseudo-nitzschia pungens, Strain cf. cingulata" /LENGTH=253 /DNA_ID=CAMNT_0013108147 /DNA_START=141 /DNA_END=902 /DNA_ORIENTATION=+
MSDTTVNVTAVFERTLGLLHWIASVMAAWAYRFASQIVASLGAEEMYPKDPTLPLLLAGCATALVVLVFSVVFLPRVVNRDYDKSSRRAPLRSHDKDENGDGNGDENESKSKSKSKNDSHTLNKMIEVVDLVSESEDEAVNEPPSTNLHKSEEEEEDGDEVEDEDEDDWNEEEYRQRIAATLPKPKPPKKETLTQMRLRVARELKEAEAQKLRMHRNGIATTTTTLPDRRKTKESRAEIKARVAREFASARRK